MSGTERAQDDAEVDPPPPGVFDEELGVWCPHGIKWPPQTTALRKLFADVETGIGAHYRAFGLWWFLFLLDHAAAGRFYAERAARNGGDGDAKRRTAYRSVAGDRRGRELSRKLRDALDRTDFPDFDTTASTVRGRVPSTARRFDIAREVTEARAEAAAVLAKLERAEERMREDLSSHRAPWEEQRLAKLSEMFDICRSAEVKTIDIVHLIRHHETDWVFPPCADWIETFASLPGDKQVARVRSWAKEARDFAAVSAD